MNEHRHVDYIDVQENDGVIISFHDGSHTYLEPEMIHYIIQEILRIDDDKEE